MPNKRIIFFIPCNPYFPSGIVRVEQYLKYFEHDGFQFEILNMIHPLSQVFLIKLDQSVFGKSRISDFLIRATIHLTFFPYKLLKVIQLLIKAKQFDIVFIQANLLPAIAIDLLKIINPNIVFDFDDAVFIRNRGRAIKMIAGAKKVFAGSHFNLDFALQYNSESVLIPSAVEISQFSNRVKPPEKANSFVIGWIGGASTIRYLHHIVSPLENLSRKGYAITVLIAGTHGKEHLLPVIDGVEKMVIREYNHSEIPQMVEKMDIGIMPLDDGPWEKGKCGLKLLIYMAAGKPSLASPVGENSVIIQDGINGFLCGTSDDWEQRFESLICNPELYKCIANNGLQTVQEEYSTEKVYQLIKSELDIFCH